MKQVAIRKVRIVENFIMDLYDEDQILNVVTEDNKYFAWIAHEVK